MSSAAVVIGTLRARGFNIWTFFQMKLMKSLESASSDLNQLELYTGALDSELQYLEVSEAKQLNQPILKCLAVHFQHKCRHGRS